MNNKNPVTIFTDGSSRGNPGPGGWGAIVIENGNPPASGRMVVGKNKNKAANKAAKVTEFGGGEKDTTNNRMELMAATHALCELQGKESKGVRIILYIDSSYVINGITRWIHSWKKNGWKTKARKSVLNADLWKKLDDVAGAVKSSGGNIEWKYVGGHIGILGNERCDHIATAFADGRKIALYKGTLSAAMTCRIYWTSRTTRPTWRKRSRLPLARQPAGGPKRIHT